MYWALFNRRSSVHAQTAHGDHSLVAATRLLLEAALTEPFTQRLQFLCPASIPLFPPLVVYAELVAENRSRIGQYPMVSNSTR